MKELDYSDFLGNSPFYVAKLFMDGRNLYFSFLSRQDKPGWVIKDRMCVEANRKRLDFIRGNNYEPLEVIVSSDIKGNVSAKIICHHR